MFCLRWSFLWKIPDHPNNWRQCPEALIGNPIVKEIHSLVSPRVSFFWTNCLLFLFVVDLVFPRSERPSFDSSVCERACRNVFTAGSECKESLQIKLNLNLKKFCRLNLKQFQYSRSLMLIRRPLQLCHSNHQKQVSSKMDEYTAKTVNMFLTMTRSSSPTRSTLYPSLGSSFCFD